MKGIFLKFIAEQYIEDFKKGNLFFKNIQYFKSDEANYLPGIQDVKEGSYQHKIDVKKNNIIILENNKEIFSFPIEEAVLSAEFKDIRHIAIMSLVFLPLTDFTEDSSDKDLFKIKPEVVEEISNEFRNRPCLLIIPKELSEQIAQYDFSNDPRGVRFGGIRPVNYYSDSNTDKELTEMNKKDVFDLCFQKKQSFSKQREARIALILKDKDSDCKIKIGDMSKHTLLLNSAESLMNLSIRFE